MMNSVGTVPPAPRCVGHLCVPNAMSPQSSSLEIPITVSSPKLPLSPLDLSSAEETEDEDSSSCDSDSSSHYGSPDLDPMLSEAAAAVHEWELVPKKHLSTRQPKMKNTVSGGSTAGSALGRDCAAAKGKSIEVVLIGSVETNLVASRSIAASPTLGMDSEVVKGSGCLGCQGGSAES
ncbi:hypothetical protein OIU85_007413 [Salix viminalis]|uniref:Uncharacterized protein n=1 Tax=Salix viminalis TaxID=40686 RepID=A0A9Q0SNB1_SALVM|nr:hypothetical protein OIU85_007413 [Salix viminalis]